MVGQVGMEVFGREGRGGGYCEWRGGGGKWEGEVVNGKRRGQMGRVGEGSNRRVGEGLNGKRMGGGPWEGEGAKGKGK